MFCDGLIVGPGNSSGRGVFLLDQHEEQIMELDSAGAEMVWKPVEVAFRWFYTGSLLVPPLSTETPRQCDITLKDRKPSL